MEERRRLSGSRAKQRLSRIRVQYLCDVKKRTATFLNKSIISYENEDENNSDLTDFGLSKLQGADVSSK